MIAMRWGLVLGMVAGCEGGGGSGEGSASSGAQESTGDPIETTSSDATTGGASESSGGAVDDGVYDDFYGRMLGLWRAPVDSWTSVGNLPLMVMDVRPVDGRTLFCRVDLDGGNALRFAFSRETHDGQPTLVYRNGGLFLGIERDSRTRLVEHDAEAERFRFCSIDRGCEYIDATFDFDGPDRFALDVDVRRAMHIHWEPTRVEDRPLETPFPADDDANPGDVPFPAMPSLRATLTWSEPLEAPGSAWILLSTGPCAAMPAACTPSRFFRADAPAGATEVEMEIVQIHAGDYRVNAILDRNANLGAALLPDAGDAIALPDAMLTIASEGATETTVPIAIEL